MGNTDSFQRKKFKFKLSAVALTIQRTILLISSGGTWQGARGGTTFFVLW